MLITDKELIKHFKFYGSYYATAKETGLHPTTVKERLNRLGIYSTYNQETGKEWVKLNKTQGPSRVLPISGNLLTKLGYKPTDNLFGTWKANPRNKTLILKIDKEGRKV